MAYVLNILKIVAKVRKAFVVKYCCHPGFAIEKLYFSGEGILVFCGDIAQRQIICENFLN